MKSILLHKIKASIDENDLIKIFFVYLLSLNIPSILSASGNLSPTILFQWQLACLAALTAYVVIRSRRLIAVSRRAILVFTSYIIVQMLIVLAFALDHNLVLISVGWQIVSIIYLFIFYIALGRMTVSLHALKKLNVAYILFVLFVCIYNLVINFDTIPTLATAASPYDIAFSSFFENRNTFGFVVGIGVILTIANWSKELAGRIKLFYALCLLILGSSLLLSMSRGAILFVFIFLVIYSIGTKGLVNLAKLLFGAALVVGAIVLAFGTEFIVKNLIRPEYGSTGRDGVHEFGMSYFLNHNIIFGSGYNTPTDALTTVYGFPSFHSIYVNLLVTGGVIQLLLYGAIISLSLYYIIKIYKYSKKTAVFFTGFIIAYLAYGLMETAMILQLGVINFIVSMYVLFLPMYIYNYYLAKSNETPKKVARRIIKSEAGGL